jgi:hypothetical protein
VSVNPAARDLAAARLAAVDAAFPGLVTAFWVTGSAVTGDWHPGVSDVDVVAALAAPADVGALAAVLAAPGPDRPPAAPVDGLWLPLADLADPPVAGEAVPHVVGGEFSTGPCGECTPVTWLELRQRGVALRGPDPAAVVPAPDPAVLRGWLLANLRGYWSGQADAVAAAAAAGLVRDEWVTWLVLGAPRLHATLATGEVLTKTAAAAYAADRWPDHADLAARCAAARAGAPAAFAPADGLAAADLVRTVVAAAGAARPGR